MLYPISTPSQHRTNFRQNPSAPHIDHVPRRDRVWHSLHARTHVRYKLILSCGMLGRQQLRHSFTVLPLTRAALQSLADRTGLTWRASASVHCLGKLKSLMKNCPGARYRPLASGGQVVIHCSPTKGSVTCLALILQDSMPV